MSSSLLATGWDLKSLTEMASLAEWVDEEFKFLKCVCHWVKISGPKDFPLFESKIFRMLLCASFGRAGKMYILLQILCSRWKFYYTFCAFHF